MSEFRLYPREQHWWTFNDYRAVVAVTRRLKPWRVLEFGPGNSTLALIEGGAVQIDACEDDPHYLRLWRNRIVGHYPHVALYPYAWADPLTIPALDGRRYDLALIDGPRDTERRVAVVEYCLARCAAVLVPLEESASHVYLRPFVLGAAERHGRKVELIESGPLAGTFALLTADR